MSNQPGSGTPGTPAPTPTPAPAPSPTPAPSPDWVSGLTPELKAVIDAKGYKTPADVVAAYANAERLIGTDKIPLPKDGVWDPAALEKLGVPKEAGGYQIKRPELPAGMTYDEGLEKAALPVLHKAGYTPAQVQAAVDAFTAYQVAQHTAATQAAGAAKEQTQQALRTEWGQAYDSKMALALRAVREFGGEKLSAFLNGNNELGNHPELVRAFAKAGEMFGEGKLIGAGGGNSSFTATPEQAREEANNLMKSEAYAKRDHPEHAATVEKVKRLFEAAYPQQK